MIFADLLFNSNPQNSLQSLVDGNKSVWLWTFLIAIIGTVALVIAYNKVPREDLFQPIWIMIACGVGLVDLLQIYVLYQAAQTTSAAQSALGSLEMAGVWMRSIVCFVLHCCISFVDPLLLQLVSTREGRVGYPAPEKPTQSFYFQHLLTYWGRNPLTFTLDLGVYKLQVNTAFGLITAAIISNIISYVYGYF